jgi:hypothetical protein
MKGNCAKCHAPRSSTERRGIAWGGISLEFGVRWRASSPNS